MPELVNCPQCERQLRVPDDLVGKKVKCPTCGTTFTAEVAATAAPEAPVAAAPPPETRAQPIAVPTPERPVPARNRDDNERDDDYVKVRRRVRDDYEPHRGTLILVFGIVSIAACHIFGPIAWVMGNNDMRAIREGRMDPEGEGLTNAGRICGIIGTVMLILGLCVGACYGAFFLSWMARAPH